MSYTVSKLMKRSIQWYIIHHIFHVHQICVKESKISQSFLLFSFSCRNISRNIKVPNYAYNNISTHILITICQYSKAIFILVNPNSIFSVYTTFLLYLFYFLTKIFTFDCFSPSVYFSVSYGFIFLHLFVTDRFVSRFHL